MIAHIAGCLAATTAGVGLWMAIGHVRGVRPRRIVATLHWLGGATLLALTIVAVPRPLLAIEMVAVALASGLALRLTARKLPEGVGMMIFAHGTVALAAAAIVAAWAMR